jgi:hypothetical protein
MKLIVFGVLGLVVSFVIYTLIMHLIQKAFPSFGGCGGMGIGFLITLPLSLLVGGIVTGFLSWSSLDTKWGLIGIAPGLYLMILMLVIYLPLTIVDVMSAGGILVMLLTSLYWYSASLVGAGLGYFLRARI